MSVKKIKILLIFLIGAFILVPDVFASSNNDQIIEELNKNINFVIEENSKLKSDINFIKNNQQDYENKLDLITSNQLNVSTANEKLLEAINTKNEGVDFKEKYWDILLNHVKIYGALFLLIAIGLGIYRAGEVRSAKEDFDKFIDRGNEDLARIIKKQESDFSEIKDKFIVEIDEVKNQYAAKLADKIDSLKIEASQIATRDIIDGISKKLLDYVYNQPGYDETKIKEIKEIMNGLALSEPIDDNFDFKGKDPRKD
ncbi:MAG: hypothetical protein WAW11_02660 [Patescibacteria group bacterium]